MAKQSQTLKSHKEYYYLKSINMAVGQFPHQEFPRTHTNSTVSLKLCAPKVAGLSATIFCYVHFVREMSDNERPDFRSPSQLLIPAADVRTFVYESGHVVRAALGTAFHVSNLLMRNRQLYRRKTTSYSSTTGYPAYFATHEVSKQPCEVHGTDTSGLWLGNN